MSAVTPIRSTRVRRRYRTEDDTGTATLNVTQFTVGKRATRNDMSRQVEDTTTFVLDGKGRIAVPTPFSLSSLHALHEKSNILRQCIAAYVTNITSNGFKVVPINDGVEMNAEEKDILQGWIDSPNTDESLRSLHSKHVNTYEKYGFSFNEVIRNKAGNPSLLRYANAASIRQTTKDPEEVVVKIEVKRGGKRVRVIERKQFRTYVQQVGSQIVHYKQFGDPRRMNYKTGRFDPNTPDELLATELMHNKQFSEDTYGIPRWISMLPAILGSREAEEVNLRYFEDNTVPPMILTVAGGRLTQQSYKDLKAILEGTGLGKDRQNQIMLLEAVPEVADIDGKGTVTLKIDKLTDARQSDGLFKEYDDANMTKVRSAFRLPPVFLGMSQDMTFATANVSAYIAEVQVFNPERIYHDEFYNKGFVNHSAGLNLKTVKLESKGPTNSSPDQVMQSLTALNVMGGLTPRTAIDAVNETMRMSLPNYPEKGHADWMEWMDQPMPFSLANSKSQQTGEGETTHVAQKAKSPKIKATEKDGKIAPKAPEHGKE